MIAQRKPNLDKGFKDLPLCNEAFRPAFSRSIAKDGSLSADAALSDSAPLVFANV